MNRIHGTWTYAGHAVVPTTVVIGIVRLPLACPVYRRAEWRVLHWLTVQGRNVVLESKYGSPRIVNDGVTVAKEVELEDPVENIGAKLVRQVLSRPRAPAIVNPLGQTAG